jgi:hypothetical protein
MQRNAIASHQTPRQFSLKWLLILLAVCAVAMRSVRVLGWGHAAWIGALSLGVILICYGFAVAPKATKYALTFVAISLVFLSLLICGIHQSRQQARRLQWSDNLRRVGIGLHEQQNLTSRPVNRPSSINKAYIPDRRVYPPAPKP